MENRLKKKLLIVDDEKGILFILSRKLTSWGYDCDTELDACEALNKMKHNSYDLIFLDINMPRLTGTEMLKELRSFDEITPVVMISGFDDVEMVRKTLREGAYDYLVKPLDFADLELTVRRAAEYGSLLQKNRDFKLYLETKVEERTKELVNALEEIQKTYDETILALGSALETRDTETKTHGFRVAQYSLLLAKNLGIDKKDQLTDIERGAYLHDIGKIGVPDQILLKEGPLSDDEWLVMKRHPEIGKRMVEGIDFLKGAVPIVFSHHERFDGKGYPQGLAGQDIPVGARIFNIVDALDAMITDRPYRKAMLLSKAKELIVDEAGRQFDPSAVEAFNGISEDALNAIKHYDPINQIR